MANLNFIYKIAMVYISTYTFHFNFKIFMLFHKLCQPSQLLYFNTGISNLSSLL